MIPQRTRVCAGIVRGGSNGHDFVKSIVREADGMKIARVFKGDDILSHPSRLSVANMNAEGVYHLQPRVDARSAATLGNERI